jgi:branched-chain amino acid transport system ATP-binding protein
MSAILAARGLSAGYGGQPVVHDLEFEVNPGEVVCLLGPNGAGKTSTMLALSGELPPLAGHVEFDGEVTRAPLHKRARMGLSYVTEERSVFKGLSARDNLRCGGVDPADALEIFPELEKRLGVRGGLLSGGEQQMLTLARALCRKPRLLVERLLQAVQSAAHGGGTGVVIVEQHARKALKYADRVLVLSRGRVRMALSAEEAHAQLADIEAHYLSGATLEDAAATGNGAAPKSS